MAPRLLQLALLLTLALALPAASRSEPPMEHHRTACTWGPPECAPFEDSNGPLLIGDPRLDGQATLGWFASIEANVVHPVLRPRLQAPVALGAIEQGVPAPRAGVVLTEVAVPAAKLDWTVMPRVELGYRFGQAAGELLAGYRFLTTTATEAALRTHLSLHVVDLDYANREPTHGPLWDMKWRAGVRLVDIYTASQAQRALAAQEASVFFVGAGPHVGLDVWRHLPWDGLSLFGRLDASSPIGRLALEFEEVRAGAVPTYGQTRLVNPGPIVTLGVQAGLSWQPLSDLGVVAGYAFENWWDLVNGFDAPRGTSLTLQGFFVRGEWRY
jgi:hypothetical protein